MILDFIHSAAGSSPLARGLLRRYLRRRINRRIIPARAGFTPAWRRACPAHPDHPRSRGVYQFALRATINILDHPRSRGVYRSKRLHHHLGHGSSPLARGLPATAGSPPPSRRIIPARAGFTLADPWNPNDEPCYQTAFTFSADLEPAPPSSGSAVVLRRSTMTPSEA